MSRSSCICRKPIFPKIIRSTTFLFTRTVLSARNPTTPAFKSCSNFHLPSGPCRTRNEFLWLDFTTFWNWFCPSWCLSQSMRKGWCVCGAGPNCQFTSQKLAIAWWLGFCSSRHYQRISRLSSTCWSGCRDLYFSQWSHTGWHVSFRQWSTRTTNTFSTTFSTGFTRTSGRFKSTVRCTHFCISFTWRF